MEKGRKGGGEGLVQTRETLGHSRKSCRMGVTLCDPLTCCATLNESLPLFDAMSIYKD